MMTTFTVWGEPVGKGRPRFTRSGHTYTPAKTKAYEEAIQNAYRGVMGRLHEGPVCMAIVALYGIPQSKPKAIQEAMRNGEILPTKKPDLDNITKAVCDALNGLAYADDSQIVTLTVKKFYADQPRVIVMIGPEAHASLQSLMAADTH